MKCRKVAHQAQAREETCETKMECPSSDYKKGSPCHFSMYVIANIFIYNRCI